MASDPLHGGTRCRCRIAAVAIIAAAVTAVLSPRVADAADTHWTNSAGGSWNVAGNWDNGIPGADDHAFIILDGTYTVSLSGNVTIANLTIGGSSGTQTLLMSAAGLTVSGSAVNGARGEIRVDAASTLGAQLDNQGLMTLNASLDLGQASAAHINSGTIQINGGTFSVGQGGTDPSFTNGPAGAINVTGGNMSVHIGEPGPHQTFTSNGAITLGRGRTLFVGATYPSNATTFDLGGTFTSSGGTLSMYAQNAYAELNLLQDISTASVTLAFNSVYVYGTGTVMNAVGRTLDVVGCTFDVDLVNEGEFLAHVPITINGAFTNAAGATLRTLEGFGDFAVTVAEGFTNEGLIDLFQSRLMVTNGTLVNAPSGEIRRTGGGVYAFRAQLQNLGLVSVQSGTLSLEKGDAAHTNSGTIQVSGGAFHVHQGGVNPSFTNEVGGVINVTGGDMSVHVSGPGSSQTFTNDGTLTLGSGRTLFVGQIYPSNSTTFNLGGTFTSSGGTLAMNAQNGYAGLNLLQDISTADVTVGLQYVTVYGSGTLTNPAGRMLDIEGCTIDVDLVNEGEFLARVPMSINGVFTNAAGAALRVTSNGNCCDVTVAQGFTNHGLIELVAGFLVITAGALENAAGGVIEFTGLGDLALFAELHNHGLVTIDLNGVAYIFRSDAHHTSSGSIVVKTGVLNIVQDGMGVNFTTSGTIDLAGGDMRHDAVDFPYGADTALINIGTITIPEGRLLGTYAPAGTSCRIENNGNGVIQGSGTIQTVLDSGGEQAVFINRATLRPGSSPAILTVDGDFQQDAAGTLELEIGGLVPGAEHDQLVVTGAAALAGTVEVSLINGFIPQDDDTFVLLTAGSRSGEFDAAIRPAGMCIGYAGHDVEARDQQGAGDIDCDMFVGVTDLLILLADWGPCPEPCPPYGCVSDLNFDCSVNVNDLLTLLASWGG